MVSSQLIGALIAVGLGFWAYSDAKALQRRGVKVGRLSPPAWGFGVALVAVLFGVLYLRQRSRAVHAAVSAPPVVGDQATIAPPVRAGDGAPPPDGRERDRFCSGCGHELPPYVASFCPKCGKPL